MWISLTTFLTVDFLCNDLLLKGTCAEAQRNFNDCKPRGCSSYSSAEVKEF